MADAGLPFDGNARASTVGRRPGAARRWRCCALALKPRPTALFATNNFITIGAFGALREAGLSVPDDISLAGFDDLPERLVLDPFLTVVAQPAYEMGRAAPSCSWSGLEGNAACRAERNRPADQTDRPPLNRCRPITNPS